MRKLFVLMALAASFATAQVARYETVITRPNNGTTYADKDIVTGTDSLAQKLVLEGRYLSGKILSARLSADTANVANATFRLFLYSDSTGTGKLADNVTFPNTYDRDQYLIGTIDFALSDSVNGTGSTVATHFQTFTAPIPFTSNRRLGVWQAMWGRLVATGAYVPKWSGKFRIVLEIEEARQ